MNGKKSTAGNSVLSVFTGNTGIIGVLVILCVVVALATDKFLTPSNIISVLRQISINTYIALGMTLIIILGHIDPAVGEVIVAASDGLLDSLMSFVVIVNHRIRSVLQEWNWLFNWHAEPSCNVCPFNLCR